MSLNTIFLRFCTKFSLLVSVGASRSQAPESPPLTVSRVEGGQADLPCDISSGPSARDSVYLVLWYRKDSGTPIYRFIINHKKWKPFPNLFFLSSYDSRTGDPGNKGLWSEPAAFGDRAMFRVMEAPAKLSISNLTKEDGGVYTCRSAQTTTIYWLKFLHTDKRST